MNKLLCRSSLTSSSWSSSSWLLIDHYYSVLRLVRRIPRTLCSSVHNIDKYIQSKRIQLNFQPNHDPHFTVHVHLPFVTLYWLGECQPFSINKTIITAKRCENDSHNSCASIALPSSSFATSSSMGRHSPSGGYSYYYEWTPLGINVNHCVRWPLNLLECVVPCIGHWCSSELLPIRIIYIYWHLKTNISHNSTYYSWIGSTTVAHQLQCTSIDDRRYSYLNAWMGALCTHAELQSTIAAIHTVCPLCALIALLLNHNNNGQQNAVEEWDKLEIINCHKTTRMV